MPSIIQCQSCGSTISSADKRCPNCGAPNDGFAGNSEKKIFTPHTVDELKEYCEERSIPLRKMRFYIGEDCPNPKASGICRKDNGFIVYENNAFGQHAIRYQGPAEQEAVGELYTFLLEECEKRGINPDDIIQETGGTNSHWNRKIYMALLPPVLFLVFCVLGYAVLSVAARRHHQNDGYYGTGDGTVYYRYGSNWYCASGVGDPDIWYEADGFPAEEYTVYELGEDWNSGWGVSDFKSSGIWKELRENYFSGSSENDSQGSGNTD